MGSRKTFLMVFMILIMATVVGCTEGSSNDESIDTPTVVKINSFYPDDMSIERIDMLRSDGERRSITNPDTIRQWQQQVGDIEVTLEPDPEDHSGSLFIVTFIANHQEVFRFTPTSINQTPIVTSHELADRMRELWGTVE